MLQLLAKHRNTIHEYSYVPDNLIFHGKGNRYFGVELEIDDGGTDNDNAQALLEVANDKVEKPIY